MLQGSRPPRARVACLRSWARPARVRRPCWTSSPDARLAAFARNHHPQRARGGEGDVCAVHRVLRTDGSAQRVRHRHRGARILCEASPRRRGVRGGATRIRVRGARHSRASPARRSHDRLLGSANGLSPGQRKVLTVAVELVSNAPVFFLDEPTSGLDSRAALIVMSEVYKVAKMGRGDFTIHQPSREIFLMFDDLLLLQRGGWQVYFGPLGPSPASTFVSYMESLPMTGGNTLPLGMNPASWMLDVLGGRIPPRVPRREAPPRGSFSTGSSSRRTSRNPTRVRRRRRRWRSSPPPSRARRCSGSPPLRAFLRRPAVDHPRPIAPRAASRRRIQLRPHRRPHRPLSSLRHHLLRSRHLRRGRRPEHGVRGIHDHHLHRHHLHERRHARSCARASRLLPRAVLLHVRRHSVLHRPRADGDPLNHSHRVRHRPAAVLPRRDGSQGELVFLPRARQHSRVVRLPLLRQAVACTCKTIQTAQAGASGAIPIAFLFGGLYLPLPQIPVYWKWAYFMNPVAFAIQLAWRP